MKKGVLYNVLVVLFFIITFTVFIKGNVAHAEDNFDGKIIGTDVAIDKSWNITFNRMLDKDTVNNSNIIVKDSSGNIVDTKLGLDSTGFIVTIAPSSSYKYGQNYNIVIKSTIKTVGGDMLGKDIQLKFSTKQEDNQNDNSDNKSDGNSNGKYTVTIDASHGGEDTGNVSSSGVEGKDINLSVALKTGKILEKNGVNVVYTRTDDKNIDVQSRIDMSNEAKSDELVSIHTNTYPENTDVHGIETYYSTSNKSEESKILASDIQKEIINATGSVDRGVKEAQPQHEILNGVDAPSVMVYLGFMSNESESELMNTSDFQDKSAEAIAKGILSSLSFIDQNSGDNQNEGNGVGMSSNESNPKVVLDPGHGMGQDVGSNGNGYQEDDVTLSIALKTGEILNKNGVNVIYTRTKDERNTTSCTVTESLQKRCDIANASGAEFMLSIHTNAFDSSEAEGTETLYYTGNSYSEKLASLIQEKLVSSLGTYNRGLKDGNWLYITRNTKIPTVLTEPGFLTNDKDASILGSDVGQEKAAQAIASAILEYLGIV
ncbi:N-acetylmuramoyl-L-alanine amidase [Clostridium sp.]|uniref:N-acetylmuramoyl-L-alanine amidase n=1 Tax=Clostridium sp. TaxID=1506 RepID=UPI003A5C4A1E